MNCPNCNMSIPNESVFCMFCGKIVDINKKSPLPINKQMPVEISRLYMGFEQGMEDLGNRKIARKAVIALQLKDDKGQETAFDGTIQIKVVWEQSFTADVGSQSYIRGNLTRAKGKIENRANVSSEKFFRSDSGGYEGQIWYSYFHPAPIVISTEDILVTCQCELWFTPAGITKKLYRADTIYLRPT